MIFKNVEKNENNTAAFVVESDAAEFEKAVNGAYLKIPVEKGLFTFEYILELIDLYAGWMPQ